MKSVIYLDSFFVINFYMDYILISLVARLLHIRKKYITFRKIMAALTGSIYACLVIAFYLKNTVVRIGTYLIMPVIFAFIIRGRMSMSSLIRTVSCLFGAMTIINGLLHLVYYSRALGFLAYLFGEGGVLEITLIFFTPLICKMICRIKRKYVNKICINDMKVETRLSVLLGNEGKTVTAEALVDTGNSLWDPIYNAPVSVVEGSILAEIIKDSNYIMGKGYHLVPFLALGNENGIIPVVHIDHLTLFCERGEIHIEKPWVAVYSGHFGNGEYQVILHPEHLKNLKGEKQCI